MRNNNSAMCDTVRSMLRSRAMMCVRTILVRRRMEREMINCGCDFILFYFLCNALYTILSKANIILIQYSNSYRKSYAKFSVSNLFITQF